MAQQASLQLKPADFKQAYEWFSENENYTFKMLIVKADYAVDRKHIKKVYSVQLPKERFFIVEYEKHKILNHLKLTPEQFRDLKIISDFHPVEVKQNPVFKKIRKDYAYWFLLRSSSASLLVALILLTLTIAQVKSTWLENIKEGFWLVSTFCAVKCSKEFAQLVVMLLYFHGTLGLSMFWGPLHYLAAFRFHKLAAQRFISLLEATALSVLGLIFFFTSFEYNRIESAMQMYADYRRGDYGKEEDIVAEVPGRNPASNKAKVLPTKTGNQKPIEPEDKF